MNHRSKLHRTAATGTVALATAACLFGMTAPVSAAAKPDPSVGATVTDSPSKAATRAGKNGLCEAGELCLYYLQNKTGRIFDLYFSDSNFWGDVFPGSAISADNNVRSYRNRDTYYWRVYSGANYAAGTEILCIAPGDVGNFSRVHWDTASSATFSSTAC
jgi:hypothetical protein